jgi:cell division protein FtsB
VTWRAAGVLVGVALAAGVAFYGVSGLARVTELRREIHDLERDLATLGDRADALTVDIDRLQNDPAYIERLGRERQGLVREGETVLQFPSPGR